MPSSTSNFDAAGLNYRRAVWIALLGALACLVGLEVGARILLPRISRIEGRMAREHRQALGLRDGLLLLGSSMLDEGIDVPELNRAIAAPWRVYRFPVEQTAFPEWKYGVRRLAADGSRPAAMALVMPPNHVFVDTVRGDYSAHYLLRQSDLLAFSKELHLHPTQIFSMWTGMHSKFFATRTDIRKVFLARIVPGMPALMGLILSHAPKVPVPPVDAFRQLGVSRLRQLRESAGTTPLLFVVHPSPRAGDGTAEIIAAAREAGLAVAAVPEGSFKDADFRDGFHLTPAGATRFTAAIAPQVTAFLTTVRR